MPMFGAVASAVSRRSRASPMAASRSASRNAVRTAFGPPQNESRISDAVTLRPNFSRKSARWRGHVQQTNQRALWMKSSSHNMNFAPARMKSRTFSQRASRSVGSSGHIAARRCALPSRAVRRVDPAKRSMVSGAAVEP